mmetsp:Transcript_12213/g.29852  ORF Transcript_12213/g.29852 Transcript_12213/m.29852 type:complete len:116 (-) Transcript_12213:114-461(-)
MRGGRLPTWLLALVAAACAVDAVYGREGGGGRVTEDAEGRHPEATEVAATLRKLHVRLAVEGSEADKMGQRDKAIECHEDSLLVAEMWRILQELHGELPPLPPVPPLARRANGDL